MIAKRIEENKEKMKEEINRLNICRGKVTERTRDEIKKVNDEIDKNSVASMLKTCAYFSINSADGKFFPVSIQL